MIELAKNYHRIYFKNYCKGIKNSYCFSNDEQFSPTFHFYSKNARGLYLGYMSFRIINNVCDTIELVAEFPNREFFCDFKRVLIIISRLVSHFDVVIYKSSPSYSITLKYLNMFDYELEDHGEFINIKATIKEVSLCEKKA